MRLRIGGLYAVYFQDHSENCDDTVPARAVGWLVGRTQTTLKLHAWMFDDDDTDISQHARFAIDRRTVMRIDALESADSWVRKSRQKSISVKKEDTDGTQEDLSVRPDNQG